MNAADRYWAMVEARTAQQARVGAPFDSSYWDRWAHTYRFDPTREPEPQLAAALRYVRPDDEIIEVGGGAGRMGLPMALRARSLRNVEPARAMREQFAIAVDEYGITNAESIASAWPLHAPVRADLVLTVDVTYFIKEIEPFVRALHESARRRVIILTWTVAPPNVNADLYQLALDEPLAPSPDFQHLLPVLWELGIVPDVLTLNQPFAWPEQLPTNDDAALSFALDELAVADHPEANTRIRDSLDSLYERGAKYRPQWRAASRAMIITWSTAEALR